MSDSSPLPTRVMWECALNDKCMEHTAAPSLHLHRYVPSEFLCAPHETHDARLRPAVSACGLRGGSSWSAFDGHFRSLQSQHSPAGLRLKTLYLLRHAEGTHNEAETRVGTDAWEATEALKDEYTDPDLTERGRAQCAAFAEGLPAALASGLSPRLIICSPMQRALRTAALCLSALPEPLPWVAVETARETLGRHTCDRRREVNEEVERAHPRVQFHLLRERHDALWTPQRETDEEQLLRAQRLLDFIFAAPEEHVLVVAHSGILTSLAKLFAQPLRDHDLSPAPKGEGASATSSPTPAPASHPHASLLDAVHAPSIASRHCELQPFIVARLPLAGHDQQA